MPFLTPSQHDSAISAQALSYLERVLAIDSASDELSSSVPSTAGQAELARSVGEVFASLGASVEQDAFANIIATLPGRGALAGAPPLALMVHLDTAKGTVATGALLQEPDWQGGPLRWPDNPRIRVDVGTYPSLLEYTGQTVLHGGGAAPIGLDDKLGLTHMLTLAWLLDQNPAIPHPPLLLIGRPDEEIGREEALLGLAATLAERGVTRGYTVDGLEPYTINVENFCAAGGAVLFAPEKTGSEGLGELVAVRLHGVNTHGATAYAEGHRAATRLAGEVLHRSRAVAVGFASDRQRDCDAQVVFAGDAAAIERALEAVVAPHQDRGAGWERTPIPEGFTPDRAADTMLRWVNSFLDSKPGFTLAAEDSHGRDGYSAPFRAFPVERGLRLDLRLRDFDEEGLKGRIEHLLRLSGAGCAVTRQYSNMGPRIAERPELRDWALAAGEAIGAEVRELPIRGGTGVDPFLDAGVAVANLGTGYFAPESEKELTTLEMLAGHGRWLLALVQAAG